MEHLMEKSISLKEMLQYVDSPWEIVVAYVIYSITIGTLQNKKLATSFKKDNYKNIHRGTYALTGDDKGILILSYIFAPFVTLGGILFPIGKKTFKFSAFCFNNLFDNETERNEHYRKNAS